MEPETDLKRYSSVTGNAIPRSVRFKNKQSKSSVFLFTKKFSRIVALRYERTRGLLDFKWQRSQKTRLPGVVLQHNYWLPTAVCPHWTPFGSREKVSSCVLASSLLKKEDTSNQFWLRKTICFWTNIDDKKFGCILVQTELTWSCEQLVRRLHTYSTLQRNSETNLVTAGAVPGAYVLRSRENLEILSMIGNCTDSGRQPNRILVAERFVSDYTLIVWTL